MRNRFTLLVGVAASVAVLALPTAAHAEPLVERGATLAGMWCAQCHVVGDAAQPSALSDAPSFRRLAQQPGFDASRLSAALLTPHPVMPTFAVATDDVRALAAYIASLGSPTAASRSKVERGRAIARQNCAGCHAISGTAASPVADAPPFARLSERYPVHHLEEALAEGIVVNHPDVDMPEFVFSPDQIDALIAYLDSIQAR